MPPVKQIEIVKILPEILFGSSGMSCAINEKYTMANAWMNVDEVADSWKMKNK